MQEGKSNKQGPWSSMRQIVSIPEVQTAISISQISSIGRGIDGHLDLTCFDYSGSVSMFPFTLEISQQSLFNYLGISENVTKEELKQQMQLFLRTNGLPAEVWTSQRLLSHLFLPLQRWILGTAQGGGLQDENTSKER